MDSIQLRGIRAYGYTGFLAEERVLGQWFEVDLAIAVDLSQAAQSDNIEDTLDYRDAIARTQQLIQTSKFSLIEKLADAIADAILELDKVQQVRVTLTKPSAPIPDFNGKIAVEITRKPLTFPKDYIF
ncbi:MAG: dihydroneopterin aldolase [Cyanobacteriota bacterium]|nr:dihydroneopterin aldolase [Cyanobacteriota bacterium]